MVEAEEGLAASVSTKRHINHIRLEPCLYNMKQKCTDRHTKGEREIKRGREEKRRRVEEEGKIKAYKCNGT